MNISIIQTSLHWHQPKKNRVHFSKLLSKIPYSTDCVVLPEMFTTGFTLSAETMSEPMQGDTYKWMQKEAEKHQIALMGSIIIYENNHYYNRLLFVSPNKNIEYYDKRHLFSYAKEEQVFQSGEKSTIISYKGWRIRPFICYDLRFPVWLRNQAPYYDILIGVANWPSSRINSWNTLLSARAIENQCYCIGCNITGSDANHINYNGHSSAYDFKGNRLITSEKQTDILSITLDKKVLEKTRRQFPVLKDSDKFTLLQQ